MIIQNKLLIAAITTTALSAVVSSASAISQETTYCNSGCQTPGCAILATTNAMTANPYVGDYPCSDADLTTSFADTCWLNDERGNYSVCHGGGESACSFFGLSTSETYSGWEPVGSGLLVFYTERVSSSSDFSHCNVTTITEYGCAENMYATSGSGSSTRCGNCPQNGHSWEGNTALSGCYLPTGTSFCDDTGCGTYTDDCHYS